MFGKNKTTNNTVSDNNNQVQNNQSDAGSSGGINGYVSPYLNASASNQAQNNAGSPSNTSAQDQGGATPDSQQDLVQPAPAQPQPNQVLGPATPPQDGVNSGQQPGAPEGQLLQNQPAPQSAAVPDNSLQQDTSDNLLDDHQSVNQILNEGATEQYDIPAPNQQVVAQPQMQSQPQNTLPANNQVLQGEQVNQQQVPAPPQQAMNTANPLQGNQQLDAQPTPFSTDEILSGADINSLNSPSPQSNDALQANPSAQESLPQQQDPQPTGSNDDNIFGTGTVPTVNTLDGLQEPQAQQALEPEQAAPTVNQLEQPQQQNQDLPDPGLDTDQNVQGTPADPQTQAEKDLMEQISIAKQTEISIAFFLDKVVEKGASDLHFTVGYPALLRIDGKLQGIGDPLTEEDVKELVNQTLNINQKELLEVNKEVDLSYAHENKARFRVNAYNERGRLAAAYRLIPTRIKTIEELQLPSTLYEFTRMSQGLFLVTGPTGSGKSTTLAAMLQEINANYSKHILTIEDPIEYVYSEAQALVDQRELGQDTHDWNIAMRSALRQDPDVVLIGEMRDFETIQSAITTAETGHMVFATLHTNSAAQSIDRIVDVFPPHQQEQIRTQLAGALKGILSQRLVPINGGGRRAAIELMIVNPAIQNLIREGKTYQIDNVVSTSYDLGMTQIERSLVKMVREGLISVETAQEYAIRPEEVIKLMKNGV